MSDKKSLVPSIRSRDFYLVFIIVFILSLLIRIFLISSYQVKTNNMSPTLMRGDYVLALKWPWSFNLEFSESNDPKLNASDVVAFTCSEESEAPICVLRVIGVPGDKVLVKGNQVILNDEKVEYIGDLKTEGEQSFIRERLSSQAYDIVINNRSSSEVEFGPEVVPPGHIFLLADDRSSTSDSRKWGMLPLKRVKAKVQLIWISVSYGGEGGFQIRKSRLFKKL